jgi:hypothetical protein
MAIELGPRKQIPLHAEVVGIVRVRDEPGDELADRVSMLSVPGHEPAGADAPLLELRGLQVQAVA